MRRPLQIALSVLLCIGSATASDQDLNTLMERADLSNTIRTRSGGTLLEESIALEQARTQARSRSDYGLELRPSVSDHSATRARWS